MYGTTAATPSTPRSPARSDASTVARLLCPCASLTFVALRTMTSVFPFACSNNASKLALRVSPSSNVPDRNATPNTTASSAPIRRRLCDHTFLMEMASMVSTLQMLHAIEDRRRARCIEYVDDATVREEHRSVGVAGCDRIV